MKGKKVFVTLIFICIIFAVAVFAVRNCGNLFDWFGDQGGGDNQDGGDEPSTPEHKHVYGDWIYHLDGEPPCDEHGYREAFCEECGDRIEEDVHAKGHDGGDVWLYDREQHWQKCKDCDSEFGYEGHTSIDSCSVCDYVIEETSGLEFRFNSDKNTYTVIGRGDVEDAFIVIPETYEGYPVTEIADNAFKDVYITTLVIPDSIVKIGNSAFENCSSLSKLFLGRGVEEIGEYAFYDIDYLGEMTMYSGVKKIGRQAFKPKSGPWVSGYLYYYGDINDYAQIEFGDNESNPVGNRKFYVNGEMLFDVTLDKAERISDYAFGSCMHIESFTFGTNIKYLGTQALGWLLDPISWTKLSIYFEGDVSDWCNVEKRFFIDGDYNLYFNGDLATKVEIPEDITELKPYVFNYCYSLEEVTLRGPVNSIGDYAFNKCDNLRKINLPSSITQMGEHVFDYCRNLEEIILDEDNPDYTSYYGVIYNKDMTEIVYVPQSIKGEVVLSDKLEIVRERAFAECYNLESIVIPDSVKIIEDYAFTSCHSLERITFGTGVKSVGKEAFYTTQFVSLYINDLTAWCKIQFKEASSHPLSYEVGGNMYLNGELLTDLVIPQNITAVNGYAFIGVKSIKSVTIHNNVTSIGEGAFSGSGVVSLSLGDGVSSIGNMAFSECEYLEKLVIPDSVTAIGEEAFWYCTRLKDISIGSGLSTISFNSFRSCESLVTLRISDNVTKIDDYAFGNCISLESVDMGKGVTYIGASAFEGCIKLKNIIMPDTVTYIGYYAFHDTAFYNDSSNWDGGVLYLGNVLLKANEDIFGYYHIKQGTVLIAPHAFELCKNFTGVYVPESVTCIESGAFYECISLEIITMGSGVTYIGNGAFYGCTSLTSITIPVGVTSIGEYAFENCTSLNTVYWNATNCTSVGLTNYIQGIFDGCTALTNIIIGENVQTIPSCAFYGCASLTSITIPSGVTYIGRYAFGGCTNLTNVIFENTEDWWVYEYSVTRKISISSSDLANSETAALYLKNTYYEYYWQRSL